MNPDTLFILTKTYPYGKGEEYVTNELSKLSGNFKKIIIYPNDHYGKDTEHNKVIPANVEILNFNLDLPASSSNTFSDYMYLLKQTCIEFFKTNDRKNFVKYFKWNMINFWTQYQIAKPFSKYLKDNSYNSINTVFYSYWFHKSAILLSILKDKRHIEKYISRAHSIDLYHNDWGLIDDKTKVPPYKLFKLKNADKVCAVSDHGKHYLQHTFKSYSQKFSTEYLGVNKAEEFIKQQYERFHIVTCSGFVENKRIHVLAEALGNIKEQVLWTHIGSGPMKDKVEGIIKNYPSNIVVDLKGNMPNKSVMDFYAKNSIDLFVNLSIVEGLPVSIMEAMSCGIPILATSVYGTPEAVYNKHNGFLIDVDFTLGTLISKLEYCIRNPDELKTFGERSKEIFLEKFQADINYQRFANVLLSL